MKPLLKPANLTDRAYDHLKTMIQEGEVSSEEPMFETQIAAALGVSRTPVREALKMLIIEGYLQAQPGGGVKAFMLKPQDLSDVLQARIALEQVTVRLAAERSNRVSVSQIDDVLSLTEQAITSGNLPRVLFQNERFHRVIASMTGTHFLEHMVDRVYDYVKTHRLNRDFGTRHWHKATIIAVFNEHLEIAEAIKSNNPELAATLMHDHLKEVGERYTHNLERDDDSLGTSPEPKELDNDAFEHSC